MVNSVLGWECCFPGLTRCRRRDTGKAVGRDGRGRLWDERSRDDAAVDGAGAEGSSAVDLGDSGAA